MCQTGLEAPCCLGRTPSPPLRNPKVIPCALPSCQGALSSHSLEGSPDSFLRLSVTWWVELEAEEKAQRSWEALWVRAAPLNGRTVWPGAQTFGGSGTPPTGTGC